MPAAIVTTVKGVSSNSYVSLDEGDAYFDDRLYATVWTAATDDDKSAALLWACKVLDTRVKWKGVKTTLGQALAWPRAYVDDPDVTGIPPGTSFSLDHWYLDQDTVPNPIKWAQCEQALALLTSDSTIDPATTGYRQVSVGPISVVTDDLVKAAVLPLPVRDLISRYGEAISGGGMQRKLLRA